MILYNLRYRGPYEYDKFILNTMQLSNETKRMEKQLKQKELYSLQQSKKKLDEYFDKAVGEGSEAMKLLLMQLNLGMGEIKNGN